MKNPMIENPNNRMTEKYSMHILIADDNSMNQFVIKQVLNKLGYRPDVVMFPNTDAQSSVNSAIQK